MSVVCLTGELPDGWRDVVLARTPRLALEWAEESPRRVWADGRGLRAEEAARAIVRRLAGMGGEVRGGVAAVPVAAWAAAEGTGAGDVAIVRAGADRAFLAPLPLEVLELDARIRVLLEGAGVERCGELAALPREAVEVRFGGEVVTAWKRSRAEDERRFFRRPPPEPPHAALDFVDYVVSDPERLVFTANALLGPLCDRMSGEGSHARQLALVLPLANGQVWRHTLKSARPTASRAAWLRLLRGVLEQLTVPDAVAGIELRIETTEAASAIQGDLFDPGFGTAARVESALIRLMEAQADVLVRPDPDVHPLPERRGRAFTPDASALTSVTEPNRSLPPPSTAVPDVGEATWGSLDVTGLTLQLLPQPRPIRVETHGRRDHIVPVRYCDDRWRAITTAAGPERISGGQWEHAYAREYYRCITGDGVLVWLFREAAAGGWYLQGWWD